MISVGVDIGTYSIKIADLEATSKSFVVRRVQEFPLSLDLTRDRKIEIIDTLRTLFQNYNPDQTQFIFSLPQRDVSMRLLDFPFRERFKVLKSVASQVEDELPFSQDDAIFDVKIVSYSGKTSSVLAMAVPKERVAEAVGLAHDCGVKPALISAGSLGLSDLFETWSLPPAEAPPFEAEGVHRPANLVLNLGHTSTQILVYTDGRLLAVRNIDFGGRNIAEAIGGKYGLNYVQAVGELQAKGYILIDKAQGTKEQITFSEVIESSLEPLVADMRLKLLELQSEMHLDWNQALMTGGMSQLRNLGPFLTRHFQIPFNRYKQFDHHPTNFEATAQLEMVTPVAVGLAIEGLRRPRNPATNFLKDEFAQQSRVFEALIEKWGYTAQLAATAFVIFFIYAVARESLTSTLLERSDEVLRKQAEVVAGLKAKAAKPEAISRFIKAQEGLAKMRKSAEKVTRLNSALDVLEAITSALPSRERIRLEIKRVTVDNEQADVHGVAASAGDRDQVLKILQRLSTTGKAEGIPVQVAVPAGKVGFAYRLHVNRLTGG